MAWYREKDEDLPAVVHTLGQRLDKLLDVVRTLAEKLVAKAPMALGLAKAIMNTCENIDMASGRILERIGQSVLIKSDDHKEGVRAFRDKRPPEYKGR